MKLKAIFCSSLAKIMPASDPEAEIRQGCALRGERFSFQLAYKAAEPDRTVYKSPGDFVKLLILTWYIWGRPKNLHF